MKPTEDPRIVYADIIDHEHHRSETRAHMSLYDRAAQFSAFDALAGYSDMIAEEARLTDAAVEADENVREELDRKLALLEQAIANGEHPLLRITLFVPDERKAGGHCVDVTERVRQIDAVGRRLILERRSELSGARQSLEIAQITALQGEIFDKPAGRTD